MLLYTQGRNAERRANITVKTVVHELFRFASDIRSADTNRVVQVLSMLHGLMTAGSTSKPIESLLIHIDEVRHEIMTLSTRIKVLLAQQMYISGQLHHLRMMETEISILKVGMATITEADDDCNLARLCLKTKVDKYDDLKSQEQELLHREFDYRVRIMRMENDCLKAITAFIVYITE